MFDDDSILRIHGTCDGCDGEERGQKSLPKESNWRFSFRCDFHHPSRVLWWLRWERRECVGGWVTKIVTKEIKPTFRFFWLWFLSPNFPHQQFWEFKILETVWWRRNIINLRVLRLRWVNSQKCYMTTQYCKFENPAIAMERNWVTKIATKKIGKQFDFFGHDFRHRIFPIAIAWPLNLRLWLGVGEVDDENWDQKKSKIMKSAGFSLTFTNI